MAPDPLQYTIPFQLTKSIRRDPYDALSPTKPENSAAGKIILITGGGTGIGAAAAGVWAKAGAEGVILAGRRPEKLEETAARIRAAHSKTKIIGVATDLLNDGDVKNLFERARKEFGRPPDVVLSNAGIVEHASISEHDVEAWWNIVAVNLKGAFATAHHFIASQDDPQIPTGTFIVTNSGLAGLVDPGVSAYSIAKLAAQRLVEYLDVEYPTLRAFTLFPGVVQTDLLIEPFKDYAHDHVELTGMLALYLASPQADWLKGSLTSINWDVEEMEANKDRIIKEDMLKIKWIPTLPASGGKGL